MILYLKAIATAVRRFIIKDSSIGTATVYRMINTLEDIGVISRRSIYEIAVDDKPLIKK